MKITIKKSQLFSLVVIRDMLMHMTNINSSISHLINHGKREERIKYVTKQFY